VRARNRETPNFKTLNNVPHREVKTPLKRLLHVGIVLEDFERATNMFVAFGLHCTQVIERMDAGIKIGFFPVGDTSIELLCFTSPDAMHGDVIRSQKGPLHHLCFEVDDLEASIRTLEKKGAKRIEGFPRAGAPGQIVFFYPETTGGILIELCQVTSAKNDRTSPI